MPDGEPGFYELVAGARRYCASKLAGRKSIPATARDLTDTDCLELQLLDLSVVRKGFLYSVAALHVVYCERSAEILAFMIDEGSISALPTSHPESRLPSATGRFRNLSG
jgi:hypothetical protein